MQETYRLNDLFNTLIELEKTGYRLYSGFAIETNNEKERSLFTLLATQEKLHGDRYIVMRDSMNYSEEIDKEYSEYISVLIKSTFHIATQSRDQDLPSDAIAIGIQLEKDTLLFLNEVFVLLGDVFKEQIKAIMNEERNHLKLLLKMHNKS